MQHPESNFKITLLGSFTAGEALHLLREHLNTLIFGLVADLDSVVGNISSEQMSLVLHYKGKHQNGKDCC